MVEMIHWPLSTLELVTPRLRLHVPCAAELDEPAGLAAAGVHAPQVQPFTVEWTDGEPAVVARRVLQYAWGTWSRWLPEDWSLWLAVVFDGTVIGSQEVSGRDFAIRREVSTGSWLGRDFHGNGFGTEMRAAVLDLAFAGLGARYAVSGAYSDNLAATSPELRGLAGAPIRRGAYQRPRRLSAQSSARAGGVRPGAGRPCAESGSRGPRRRG
jgi:RimJ/RimL family protein N-acetyltransferase